MPACSSVSPWPRGGHAPLMAFHIPHCLAALWGQHPKPVELGLQIPQAVQGRGCWAQ